MLDFIEKLVISIWHRIQGRRKKVKPEGHGVTLGYQVVEEAVTERRVSLSQTRRRLSLWLIRRVCAGFLEGCPETYFGIGNPLYNLASLVPALLYTIRLRPQFVDSGRRTRALQTGPERGGAADCDQSGYRGAVPCGLHRRDCPWSGQ